MQQNMKTTVQFTEEHTVEMWILISEMLVVQARKFSKNFWETIRKEMKHYKNGDAENFFQINVLENLQTQRVCTWFQANFLSTFLNPSIQWGSMKVVEGGAKIGKVWKKFQEK